MAVAFSLQSRPIGREGRFVGLENFQALLADPLFYRMVLITLQYTITAVALKFLMGLVSALVLRDAVRGRNVFRALLLLPWAAPVVVGAFTWRWILDDMNGVLSLLLWKLGVISQPIAWLADPKLALWSVIAVVVWQGTPFYTLNFLAGMASIDSSLYEAAAVDGASRVQRFLHVTLPGLQPVIVVTVLLSSIWTSNNLQFVFILTQGGPLTSTMTLQMQAYLTAMHIGQLGEGAAVALSLVPFLTPLIVLLTLRLLREEEIQ
jgi:ABC-type sugar transport system permease subunit